MQTSPQWPRRRNRRGVSLIEILVVLAILVVGILAIIRLFPSGFFSIESVGNTALADTIGSAANSGRRRRTRPPCPRPSSRTA